MKQGIKVALLLVALSLGMVQAQTYQVELGSNNYKYAGKQVSTSYYNGIRLGGKVRYDLKNNFSFLTGALYDLAYSTKLQRYTANDSVRYRNFNHMLTIPVHIQYDLKVSKSFKFMAFAGPNIGVGLFNSQNTKAVMSATTNALIEEYGGKAIHSGTADLYQKAVINRINLQMSVGGGVQWRNYQLKGGYDFGINSLNKIDTSKQMRQSGWFVSLVYEF